MCKYALVPFEQTYIYEQMYDSETGDAIRGLFLKYVEGQKDTLSLPTVVVDFLVDDTGAYATMTEYTCKGSSS